MERIIILGYLVVGILFALNKINEIKKTNENNKDFDESVLMTIMSLLTIGWPVYLIVKLIKKIIIKIKR